jgi:hypothetical protein
VVLADFNFSDEFSNSESEREEVENRLDKTGKDNDPMTLFKGESAMFQNSSSATRVGTLTNSTLLLLGDLYRSTDRHFANL